MAREVGKIIEVDTGRIRPMVGQPRSYFDQDKLKSLAQSIKSSGQKKPAEVRTLSGDPKHDYELIDGQRRWHACRMISRPLRCIVNDKIADPEDQFLASAVSNFNQEELTPLEIARAIVRIGKRPEIAKIEGKIARATAIGDFFGRSNAWVTQHERLLELHPEVLKLMDPAVTPVRELLSKEMGVQLTLLARDRQVSFVAEIKRRGFDYHEARALLSRIIRKQQDEREGAKGSPSAAAAATRGIAFNKLRNLVFALEQLGEVPFGLLKEALLREAHAMAPPVQQQVNLRTIEKGIEQLSALVRALKSPAASGQAASGARA